MSDQVIEVPGERLGIAPFAFQHYAKKFLAAYSKHKIGPKFSPARFFLLTRSIELAAKSLHLAQVRVLDDVLALQHDLEPACAPDVLQAYGITLTASETTEVGKANRYYKGKGFEYFLFKFPGIPMERSGPQQALSGWPDLPDEKLLEGLVGKLLTPKL